MLGVARDFEVAIPKPYDAKMGLRSLSFRNGCSEALLTPRTPRSRRGVMERSPSFKNWEQESETRDGAAPSTTQASPRVQSDCPVPNGVKGIVILSPKKRPVILIPSPKADLDAEAAAVTMQKFYKGHRTRRTVADCAIVVEELWWRALDYANLSTVTSLNLDKNETAVKRWTKAKRRLAKVGKGLLKDEKAQKLALQHWLEAIDPRHRYGHNLHMYYDVWFASESSQPFFYWLDVGDGKGVHLEKCPRSKLQKQCIEYLGPNERKAYEVIVEYGKLVYKYSKNIPVNTDETSKWIFVLSTSRNLYVGQKKKGKFQHSSFLAGAATTAAGRLVAKDGILKAIWPYSGHYLPTDDNFKEFISFLADHNVDLSNVKRCAVDDDEFPSFRKSDEPVQEPQEVSFETESQINTSVKDEFLELDAAKTEDRTEVPLFEFTKRLSCKWSTGAGPRIGCVRDYPADLQSMAMEQVNLSPRVTFPPMGSKTPIPSPRPSPKMRISPRLSYMGIPSPRVTLTLPTPKRR